ncbi:hypothetical protein RIF29_31331 [Crotalaria pallida]|uniref:TypA/BipA C-terminal domain-containing protein n=1 Tax=Crotalaria pallida TaxID=3830 RepID=A0AAN9EJH2_CROPI
MGCNLAAPRDNGRFSFIDMLMLQCPGEKIRMAYLASVSLSKKSQNLATAGCYEGKPNHVGLAAIFEKIERVISTLYPDNKKFVTVMIDDISLLEVAANGSSNDVLDFLHYCHTLTSEYGFAFVALDHKNIYLNEEWPALILEVEFLADILVNAEPLATGLAKDVHGQAYDGMISKDTDLDVNPVRAKALTNVFAASKDENVRLTPPRLCMYMYQNYDLTSC